MHRSIPLRWIERPGFRGNVALPWGDNFGVARLDHDFKPSGTSTLLTATTKWSVPPKPNRHRRILPGDKFGTPASVLQSSPGPWYLTAGITTNITSTLTNDFPLQLSAKFLGPRFRRSAASGYRPRRSHRALRRKRTNVLAPYNLDTQDVRTRFWDGQDNMIRDDVTWLKGHSLHPVRWLLISTTGTITSAQITAAESTITPFTLGSGFGTNGMNMAGFVPATYRRWLPVSNYREITPSCLESLL